MRWTAIAAIMLMAMAACTEVKISDEDILLVPLREIDDAAADRHTVIVDARRPEDYASGHLPDAVNIYLPDIRHSDTRLASARRIIVYAAGVRDPLGIAAAKRLKAMGYINVQEFKGGVEEWTHSGRPLVGSLPAAEARPDTAKD